MNEIIDIAIIGGSGLYNIPDLRDTKEHILKTPFGAPSSPIVVGSIEGHRVAFLSRHGPGHRLTPTEVPYRANIFALKLLGVDRILSISACGSLLEKYSPGHIVIPDQLYDNTRNRQGTFFGEGLVGHIGVADPFCEDLSNRLETALKAANATVHRQGAMITIEGPRFSTRVESNVYRSWGMSLIGMTTSPEAFLAREAGICYSVMAHVTDYDVWRISEEPVSVELVVKTLNGNTRLAQKSIHNLVENLTSARSCNCQQALDNALITQRNAIPIGTMSKLEPLIRKYFGDQ